MRAILEFDLPDDNTDFENAIKGKDYYCALFDIKNRIRCVLKYNEEITVEQLCEQLQELIPLLD